MDPIDQFLVDNAHVISFVSGLTLFVLGLSIVLESSGASASRFRDRLKWLACYGFAAGLAHWLRLFMLTSTPGSLSGGSHVLDVARLLCLLLAALVLLRFATELIPGTHPWYRGLRWAPVFLGGLYLGVVSVTIASPGGLQGDWVSTVDGIARHFLLFPGLGLTSVVLWGQFRHFSRRGLPSIARDSLGAALAFGGKAIASGLAAFPIFGPAGSLPAALVLTLLVTRMVANGAVACFVVRSLRFFEVERRRRLDLAVEQQLQAQQEAMKAQREAHSAVEQWATKLEDVINTIASVMSEPADLKEVLDESLGKVLELTGFEAGHICLVQGRGRDLHSVTHRGLPLSEHRCRVCLRMDDKVREEIHSIQEIVVVPNLRDHPPLAGCPCHESQYQLLVSVPISNRGHRLGIMHLLGGDELVPQAHELGVLSAIAQQVGVVIENAMLYEEVQSLAALEERGRLSRELHDGLAQVLGYLHLKSKATSLLLASGRLKQAQLELEEMQQVAGETQQDVRESILGLRTTVPPGSSLIPTIVEYVHRFKGYNGPCTRVMVGEDVQLELSPLAEVQLLRIVQEALLNVRKHAGASRAWIRFEVEGERAVMTIEDNGQGFDLSHSKRARSGHFGLQTMKERAESVGAEFQIVTHTGQGTSVIVRLPVDDGGM